MGRAEGLMRVACCVFRHAGAVGGGGAFPAVAVLAGLNEDLLVGGRGGESGEVEGGDVADAVGGDGEESQIDGASHAGPAGAARGAGKEQEVTFDMALED